MKQAEIATAINTALQAGVLNFPQAQKGQYSSVAELILRTDEDGSTIPAVVSNTGQGTDITVNDIYPIQIYHRIEDVTQAADFEDGFGNEPQMTETSDMIMIIIGNRLSLQLTKEDTVTAIAASIPAEWTPTVNYIKQTSIEVGDINMKSHEVYQGEYNSEEKLPPNYFMASVNYQIISKINQKCIELCTIM